MLSAGRRLVAPGTPTDTSVGLALVGHHAGLVNHGSVEASSKRAALGGGNDHHSNALPIRTIERV